MSQIADISPTLKDTVGVLSSLTAEDWAQLYLRPLAVLYLQEAARLSHMEKQEISPWTLSLHREHVRLLEKQFLRHVREIHRQCRTAGRVNILAQNRNCRLVSAGYPAEIMVS